MENKTFKFIKSSHKSLFHAFKLFSKILHIHERLIPARILFKRQLYSIISLFQCIFFLKTESYAFLNFSMFINL